MRAGDLIISSKSRLNEVQWSEGYDLRAMTYISIPTFFISHIFYLFFGPGHPDINNHDQVSLRRCLYSSFRYSGYELAQVATGTGIVTSF